MKQLLTYLRIKVVNSCSDDGTDDQNDQDSDKHALPVSFLTLHDDCLQFLFDGHTRAKETSQTISDSKEDTRCHEKKRQ